MTYESTTKCKAKRVDGKMECKLCLKAWPPGDDAPTICLDHGNEAMRRTRAPMTTGQPKQNNFYSRRTFDPERYSL